MAYERDMTHGSAAKLILGFALPVFVGNVFQQFYSMVDTIIVGRFVGTKALAAVGSTGTISFLIIGFLMGLTTGFTIPTAQAFGAGDMPGMRRSVAGAIILSAILTAILTAVSLLGMRGLLLYMNTPADIFDDAYRYIMIICQGMWTIVLYNLVSSLLRSLGNSRIPLYFLILSALLNIALDLLFVVTFGMGVAGAAWATVISQGVSGLLCLLYIALKMPLLRLTRDDWGANRQLMGEQLRIGLPMALQFSITAIGAMMVQASLNRLGSLPVAAFSAASKITGLLEQGFAAMGATMATWCAQNYGARKFDRIRTGFHTANLISCVYALAVGALAFFLGRYVTPLFVSENVADVTELVDVYLKCVGVFFVPLGLLFNYRNGIQGMGYGVLPMMAGVAELVARGAVAIVAGSRGSYLGICLASPAAWILAASFLLMLYRFISAGWEKPETARRVRHFHAV